ncbi:MAG: hypothetical protein KF753_14530 [Caldilineaceae bacterium]|nr:hypothetical protein [Caldilineaceae bacterium]
MSEQLTGTVHRPGDISLSQRARMCELLNELFENVSREQFDADLAEKEWVFVFSDDRGTVQGFSTLMCLNVTVDGRPVVAVYSGDTLIHPDFWHELELPKLWGKHVFDLAAEVHAKTPEAKVYWFLISSGYKTYRFLPVFFANFYPTYRQPTPPQIQRTIDALARYKFGDQYDPAAGIIRFAHSAPLREGVAEVDERRLKNRDIAFFVEKNPGHAAGEQLACLVEIDHANITSAGMRMLGMERG